MKHFHIKLDSYGRSLLNLACGPKTDPSWNNLDFSPYALLARHPRLTALAAAFRLLSPERKERLAHIDPTIVRWDLAKGIPFPEDSFDVVYHSHFLEHLDRESARTFLLECRRTLKPGGILRIVLPDLGSLVRNYVGAVTAIVTSQPMAEARHDKAVHDLFDQMVRTESSGAKEQKGWRRTLESLWRGDARKTGESHRWMYDRHSLARLLTELGFEEIDARTAATSGIEHWHQCRLDLNQDGSCYKPDSLYLEARKPQLAWYSTPAFEERSSSELVTGRG